MTSGSHWLKSSLLNKQNQQSVQRTPQHRIQKRQLKNRALYLSCLSLKLDSTENLKSFRLVALWKVERVHFEGIFSQISDLLQNLLQKCITSVPSTGICKSISQWRDKTASSISAQWTHRVLPVSQKFSMKWNGDHSSRTQWQPMRLSNHFGYTKET